MHRNPHGSGKPRKHKIRKHKRQHNENKIKLPVHSRQTSNNRGILQQEIREAMNILHSISSVREFSMTFQREKEDITEQHEQVGAHTTVQAEKNA